MPAARQMLEQVAREPMLNPMHPPLAKQMIALSINTFGDNPLGWRYPGTLFGALAIARVLSRRTGAVQSSGAGDRRGPHRFCNQMLFVQSRIAMLDTSALAFSLFAIAAYRIHGFGKAAAPRVRARGRRFRLLNRLQMERAVRARHLHRHRRGDPPDARLAHAVRRRQSRRLVPAGFVARFPLLPFRDLLRPAAGAGLSRDLRPALRVFAWRHSGGAAADRAPTTPPPRSRAIPI